MAKRQLDVEIRGDNRNLKKSVKDTEKTTNSFTDTVKKTGAALLAAFAARKIISGIRNLINNLTETADRLLDLKDITGLSTDALQEYEYIAKIAGVNTEAIASAAQNLTNRFQHLYRESSPISRAFREMGIEAHTANGELRATDEIMDDALVALAEMTNQTERNALAAQIFGGSWKELAPILAMGKDGIEDLRKEAHDMGIVMEEDALQKANDFRKEMERFDGQMEAFKRSVGMWFIPAFSSMLDYISRTHRSLKNFLEFIETGGSQVTFDTQRVSRQAEDTVSTIIDEFSEGGQLAAEEMVEELQNALEREMAQLSPIPPFDPAEAPGRASREDRREYQRALAEYEREKAIRREIQDLLKEKINTITREIEIAEENRKLAEESALAEQERIDNLGTLERLEEQLAEQKQSYQTANDEQAAALHQKRIWELEQQIAKLKELRELAAIEMWLEQHAMPGMEGVEPMESMPGMEEVEPMESIEPTDWLGRFQDDHDTTMDEVINKEKETADELVDIWDTAGNEIAHNLSFAFAEALSLIGQELATGEADWHEYVGNVLSSISRLLAGLLAQAIAGMIANEVSSKGVAGLAVATVGVAALGALWESTVPKFEEGVIATGPTLGIFGEYATARTDPEIAGKFSDFERMMGNSGGGTYEFVIKGNTLHSVLQRESTRRNQLG